MNQAAEKALSILGERVSAEGLLSEEDTVGVMERVGLLVEAFEPNTVAPAFVASLVGGAATAQEVLDRIDLDLSVLETIERGGKLRPTERVLLDIARRCQRWVRAVDISEVMGAK